MPQTARKSRRVSADTTRADRTSSPGAGRLVAIIAVLIAVTALVYARAASLSFVNWDDDVHITKNPFLYPVTDIAHFWSQPHEHLYIPMTYSFWGILVGIAKTGAPFSIPGFLPTNLDPRPFHIATLLLHLCNVALVFLLLSRFVRSDVAAAFGAALFALHPLQVESVAWISETKGTLSACFGLICLNLYVLYAARETDTRRWIYYGLSVAAFLLALLSKPAAVSLPVMAVAIDILLLKRSWQKSLASVAPWLLLVLIIVAKTQSAQPVPESAQVGIAYRPLVAGDALAFYLAKFLVPIRLATEYGRSPVWLVKQSWAVGTMLASLALIALAVLVYKRWPAVTTGFALFVAALLPVLGFLPFVYQTYSTVADRYAYLALLGPALILAWLLDRRPKPAFLGIAGAWIAVLAVVSVLQIGIWQNSFTLFRNALAVNPGSYVSYNNLATAYENEGKHDLAIANYKKSYGLKPDYEDAYANLGAVYTATHQLNDAVATFLKAVDLAPNDAEAHNSLAVAYSQLGRYSEAIDEYRAATRIKPDMQSAHGNLGFTLMEAGRTSEAIDSLNKAIQINPDDATAQYNLSVALTRIGKADEAVGHLDIAKRLDPKMVSFRQAHDPALPAAGAPSAAPASVASAGGAPASSAGSPASTKPIQLTTQDKALLKQAADAEAQNQRAAAVSAYQQFLAKHPGDPQVLAFMGGDLGRLNKLDDAETALRQALKTEPDLNSAHADLGMVLYMKGRLPEAQEEFETFLTAQPDNAEAHFNLGVILAKLGKKDDAVSHLTEAIKLRPGYSDAQQELARVMAGTP